MFFRDNKKGAMKHIETVQPWGGRILYEMNIRQLTAEGTFAAAIPHLALLHAMGVDALWLMPVYPIGEICRKGSLGSYYSIRDYCAVNPEFGTMEEFDRFVAEAHALGMQVLLDWVANHTSRDARWLAEKPYGWYERNSSGEAAIPFDWSDTAKLDYSNREVWQGEIDAMLFWLTKHHIDGFRCDMAMLMPPEFWHEAVSQLRQVKPDIFMLAEAEERWLFDNGFNACYTWRLHHMMCDIAQGRCRTDALRRYIYEDRETYPAPALRMTFTSNHDENSWNGSEFERLGDAAHIMAALTFVLPQSLPLIYTGQEFGYDHRFAFFDKDPMPAFTPNGQTDFYSRLAAMKHRNAALHSLDGSFVEIRNNAEDCLMTFVRESAGNRVVCIMNLSPYAIHADFNTGIYAGIYRDALCGGEYTLHTHVEQDMVPWQFTLLEA